MSKTTQTASGVGFLGWLTLIFIVLKLCNVINWSWWFVLMPLYLPITIVLVVVFGVFLIALIAQLLTKNS